MKKYVIGLIVGLFVCPDLGSRPPSLSNVGNTCYFNATLQNFYNFEPITKALLRGEEKQGTKSLLHYFVDFAALVNASPHEVKISDKQIKPFVDQIILDSGGELKPLRQADSMEVFSIFTHGRLIFEDGSSMVGETVPVFKKYMGFRLGALSAKVGVVAEREIEPALFLAVQYVPKKSKVERDEVIRAFFDPEFVGGVQKKKNGLSYVIRFVKYDIVGTCPEILAVQVKVFFQKVGGKMERIDTNFDVESFLKVLDVKQYLIAETEGENKGKKDEDTIYNLIGVVLHFGTLDSGHYTALIKDQYDPARPWYLCNDSSINPIEESTMKKEISTKGYVFFYRKKSAEDASIATQLLNLLARSLYAIANPT